MDERVWTDTALADGEQFNLGSVTIRSVETPVASYLITGDLKAARQSLSLKADALGLLDDQAGAATYTLRISRDSMLLVSDVPLAISPGWNKGGFGISEATDGYAGFAISGKGAEFILAQGGIQSVTARSASASTQFADLTVLLIRDGADYLLWVPRAYAVYMTSFFRGMSEPLPR